MNIPMNDVLAYLTGFGCRCETVSRDGQLTFIRLCSREEELVVSSHQLGVVGVAAWKNHVTMSVVPDTIYGRSSLFRMLALFVEIVTVQKGVHNNFPYTLQYEADRSMRPRLTVGGWEFMPSRRSEPERLFVDCLKGEVPIGLVLDWYEDNRGIYP